MVLKCRYKNIWQCYSWRIKQPVTLVSK